MIHTVDQITPESIGNTVTLEINKAIATGQTLSELGTTLTLFLDDSNYEESLARFMGTHTLVIKIVPRRNQLGELADELTQHSYSVASDVWDTAIKTGTLDTGL